jgi:NADH:ubiquinone oxidoreductase subunit 5 (subunit L)/multisubunit Na+/H+ antiporter MnhA subunit
VWVLWPLAFLSLFAGFSNLPPVWSGKELLAHYLGAVPGSIVQLEATPSLEWLIAAGDGSLAAIALVFAYFLYGPGKTLIRLRGEVGDRLQAIFSNAFYLDWLYRKIIAGPYRSLAGFLWITVDEGIVDAGMIGYGKAFDTLSAALKVWTTGRLSTYLQMLLLGFMVIVGTLAIGLYGGW